MKIKKAVIPVAGFGTRFLPVTKSVPKELLPIVNKPTIQYIVEEAVAAGIEQIVFVTSTGKHSIEDYFDKHVELEKVLGDKNKAALLEEVQQVSSMIEIHTVRQKEQKGLGHAIWTAREFIGNEPFAVLLGDDIVDSQTPAIKQLIDVAEKYEKSVVLLERVPMEKASSYGVVDVEPVEPRVGRIKAMVEKPENPPSNLAIIGRYVLEPEIFDILTGTEAGKGGEIQITDAMITLNGEKCDRIYGCELDGIRHDAGDVFGFIKANVAYGLKRPDLREKLVPLLKDLAKDL